MNLRVFTAVVVGCVLAQVVTVGDGAERGEAQPDSWPQWRGLQRTGLVKDAVWPKSLDERHLVRPWEIRESMAEADVEIVLQRAAPLTW